MIAEVFATRPRDHWVRLFAGTDACAYPVLDLVEIPNDPHVLARGSVTADSSGYAHVAPAPRLSQTPGHAGPVAAVTRQSQLDILAQRGVGLDDIERFQASGALHLVADA